MSDAKNEIVTLLDQIDVFLDSAQSNAQILANQQAEFDKLAERARSLIGETQPLFAFFDRLDQVAANVCEFAEQISSWTSEATELLGEFDEVVDGALEVFSESTVSTVETTFAIVDEFTSETVDGIFNEVDACLSKIEDAQEKSTELVESLYKEALPEVFGKESAQFLNLVEQLNDCGLGEVKKMQDKLQMVTDKSRALTDLIGQVKPVLETARQLL